jgi:hypothetical protein
MIFDCNSSKAAGTSEEKEEGGEFLLRFIQSKAMDIRWVYSSVYSKQRPALAGRILQRGTYY